MSSRSGLMLSVYTIGTAILFIVPIAVIIAISFSGNGYLRFPPTSLSIRWFSDVAASQEWRSSLGLSATIAAIAALISAATSSMAAYSISRGGYRAKKIILAALLLPMIVPGIVAAVGLYFLSIQLGLVGNVLWVSVCHSVVCAPPVFLIMLTSLRGIDPNLERAAYSLGSSRWRVIRQVTLPLALPGIISGLFVAFLGSFDEFIVASFLMGTSGQTLPVKLFQSIVYEIQPSIAAVSTIIILFVSLLVMIERYIRRIASSV